MRKLMLAAAVVVAMACGTDVVQGPTPVQDQGASTDSGQATQVDTGQGQATPASTASAKVWEHGLVDVTGPWDGLVCYFWYGPHEQAHAADPVPVNVGAGQTVSIPLPVQPGDRCVQIDVATSCAKSSIMPGLIADGRVGNCSPTPQPTPSPKPTPPPLCEGDECPCEVEWTPILGPAIEEIFEPSCEGHCGEILTKTWDAVFYEINSCTQEKREVSRVHESSDYICDACPVPDPICHVSNVGPPAGSINLQVTYKAKPGVGHQGHCADFTPVGMSASCSGGCGNSCRSHDSRCPCSVAITSWEACHP